MNSSRFSAMLAEFPFLAMIFAEQDLCADRIGNIEVSRADLNLLEVTPRAWAHDMGQLGDDEGHRLFWFVDERGQTEALASAWLRSSVPHGITADEKAAPIGAQLALQDRDFEHIVEVRYERDDYGLVDHRVVVYKMEGFVWRRHVRRPHIA